MVQNRVKLRLSYSLNELLAQYEVSAGLAREQSGR